MSDNTQRLIELIESCDFACAAGPLTMSRDWKNLIAALEAKDQEIERQKALHLNCTKRCHKALSDVERLEAELKQMGRLWGEEVARAAVLEGALENSYCELCGCAECLEREQALGERE